MSDADAGNVKDNASALDVSGWGGILLSQEGYCKSQSITLLQARELP